MLMEHGTTIGVERTSVLTPALRARLGGALCRGRSTWSEIEIALAEGRMMVWRAGGLCITTEVDVDGICDIRLGGGALTAGAVETLEKAVLDDPAHVGVRLLRIRGRRGWTRLLPHWRCIEDGELVTLERDA